MNKKKTAKQFDCVEMKRQIQEKIYEETRGMGHEELLTYFRKRIAESRFASFIATDGKHSVSNELNKVKDGH